MIFITFIAFESLLVLSMGIYQGHSVLLGVRMIAFKCLHFDLPPLDEFT